MRNNKDNKRVNTENMFNGKENLFFGILNDMVTFVWVLSPDGTVIFANNTALEPAGLALEDVKGKKLHDAYWWAYSGEAREKIREDVTRCASGERVIHEIQAQIAEGSPIWIEFSMHPVYENGNLRYLVSEGRDITDRKQALADARAKVAYLDNMPTYMAVTDLEGNLQFTSAVTIKKFGWTLEDVIGTRFDQMAWWDYSRDVQERMREVVSEAAAKGKSFEFEVDLRIGEELVPIKYTCDPLVDENGEIYALLHTGTRIDELRAAITDAQQKVAYLDNMPTYMAVTDLEGNLQFTSAVTIEKFGIKLEDVLGTRFDQMPWWEYSEDVQRRMKEVYERAAKGEEFEFEVDVKMGENLYPIKYTCEPLRNEKGEIYAILHTGTRIDELRAALDDARAKVAYLNNIPTPVMVVDREFTIQFVNPSWSEMVGITPEDAVGRKCYDLVRSADCQTERCCIARAIMDESVITCERVVHSVRGDITTRYTGAPLKDAEGKIVGGLEYLVNISDLKRLMEEEKKLSEAILKLSTPIIQIWDKVLLLPLIGTIDEERAEQIVENLLGGIVATGTEVVIIDLSGVPMVDTMATHQLLKTESAARMLGARVIFTGLSPAIAQTMTKLGIDLARLETRQSLRVGLEEAIEMVREVES
ncbi:PAS fold protein [Candidatus Methanoperedenaceae archaeon GB37]|nr:PAS fold protein [Candidatus Methanoperedenaceae archaeon GB37]